MNKWARTREAFARYGLKRSSRRTLEDKSHVDWILYRTLDFSIGHDGGSPFDKVLGKCLVAGEAGARSFRSLQSKVP